MGSIFVPLRRDQNSRMLLVVAAKHKLYYSYFDCNIVFLNPSVMGEARQDGTRIQKHSDEEKMNCGYSSTRTASARGRSRSKIVPNTWWRSSSKVWYRLLALE